MDRDSFALRLVAFLAFVALLAGATVAAYDAIGPSSAGAEVTPVIDRRTTAAGATVAFPLAVESTGADTRTVSFRVADDAGLDVTPPSTLRMGVDEATGAFVTVTVPADANPGTHEVVLETTVGDRAGDIPLTVVVEEPEQVVELGDTAEVRYVGRLANGTMFGTNVEEVDASPIPRTAFYQANAPFRPLNVPTGPDAGFIPGFRQGVVGVGLNHSTTITVPPSLGFGNATIEEVRSRTETLDRNASFQRVFSASRQAFGNLLNASSQEGDIVFAPLGEEQFPFRIENLTQTQATLVLDVEVGDRLTPPEFQRFGENLTEVVDVNETAVTFRVTPTEGDVITYHGYWPNATRIVEVNETTIVVRHTPEEGVTFQERRGQSTVTFTVEEVREDEIVVTRPNSSPLAGETTIFDITVVGIQPGGGNAG